MCSQSCPCRQALRNFLEQSCPPCFLSVVGAHVSPVTHCLPMPGHGPGTSVLSPPLSDPQTKPSQAPRQETSGEEEVRNGQGVGGCGSHGAAWTQGLGPELTQLHTWATVCRPLQGLPPSATTHNRWVPSAQGRGALTPQGTDGHPLSCSLKPSHPGLQLVLKSPTRWAAHTGHSLGRHPIPCTRLCQTHYRQWNQAALRVGQTQGA